MSVPLLAVATATAPTRATRATGDPATGARFGDALSDAARALAASDGDPAAAPSSGSGRIAVAGLSAEASVSGGDDPAPGDESSSEGPDAGTPAPVAMTLMPFPVPPTTPGAGDREPRPTRRTLWRSLPRRRRPGPARRGRRSPSVPRPVRR